MKPNLLNLNCNSSTQSALLVLHFSIHSIFLLHMLGSWKHDKKSLDSQYFFIPWTVSMPLDVAMTQFPNCDQYSSISFSGLQFLAAAYVWDRYQ